MKKFLLLLGLFLFLGCIDQSEEVSILPKEEILEVFENNIEAGEISLDFQNYNGYMEVHLWDKWSYRIEINKWARATTSQDAKRDAKNLKVDFSEVIEDEIIILTLKTEDKISAGADVTAYLPRGTFTTVDLSTFNGYIRVEEMTALDATLVTANGDIRGFITASTLRVTTSNGKIQGSYQGHVVTIETTNGRIDIECGVSGEYDIETVNGDIDVIVYSDFAFNLKSTIKDIIVDADNVIYILDERDHKKGYTSEDTQLYILASTTFGSVTIVRK
jgi:DUF4097 and DUF4098 domain-containing protein YvlB